MEFCENSFFCGIDIGTVNLSFCFVSQYKIIAYRGTCKQMFRYEINLPVVPFCVNSSENDDFKCISKMIDIIPEFANTKRVRIEKQVSGFKKFIGGKMQTLSNNPEILRYEMAVYMKIYAKFPFIDLDFFSPRERIKEIERIFSVTGKKENIYMPKKSIKEEKIPSIEFTANFFPSFYDFIIIVVEDNKLDDICDCLVYAVLQTPLSPKT